MFSKEKKLTSYEGNQKKEKEVQLTYRQKTPRREIVREKKDQNTGHSTKPKSSNLKGNQNQGLTPMISSQNMPVASKPQGNYSFCLFLFVNF